MKSATVIIPTHNRKALVQQTVRHLLKQNFPQHRLQIIVVADRCDDGTEETLREEFGDRIALLGTAKPGGTAALNTGIAAATGDIAIFIDDEMWTTPGFVAAHVAAHEAEPGARIAVTGYSPVAIGKSSDPLHEYIARNYEEYHKQLAAPGRRLSPTDMNAGNMSLPLSVLREAGGFNETYFFQRNDFELATRLVERGFEIRFCPEARADQHLGLTGGIMVGRAEPRAQSDVRLAREHPWCVSALAFHRQLESRTAMLKWRAAWIARGVLPSALAFARRLWPGNPALVKYTYAVRYAIEVVRVSGGWAGWEELSRSGEPWPSPRQ